MQKFIFIALFVPLLASAFPSLQDDSWMQLFDKENDETVPKPCCLPEVWQGFVESNVAQLSWKHPFGKYSVSKTQVFVDGPNKRVAATIYCRKTGKAVGGFIGLFDQSSGKGFKMYLFSKENPDKCFSFYNAKAEYKKTCIPEKAKFKGKFALGLSSSPLKGNSFSFYLKQKYFELMGNAVVTKDCVPLIYREAGKIGGCKDQTPVTKLFFKSKTDEELGCGGKKFVVNAHYHNLDPEISDKTVFDLPKACKNKSYLPFDTEFEGDENDESVYLHDKAMEFINYVTV